MVIVYCDVSISSPTVFVSFKMHSPISLILYMIYYPEELKYEFDSTSEAPGTIRKAPKKRDEWQTSIILAWIVVAHLYV